MPYSNPRLRKGNQPLLDSEQSLFSSKIPARDRDSERDLRATMLRAASREFTKQRRWRQRERHWKKELMSSTMAVHVRYNSLYISLPFSTRQQREMTNFCLVLRMWTKTANFWNFISTEVIAMFRIKFCDSFESDQKRKRFWLSRDS